MGCFQEQIHNKLNDIYRRARESEQLIKHILEKDCFIEHSSNNYIKIGDKYEIQEYPIPVIVIKDEFDIGFNIDGLFIEKFYQRDILNKIDVSRLK